VINRGIQTVCAGVLLPGKYEISPPLPDLYAVDEIDTTPGEGVVSLPDDFGRNLVMVVNDLGEEIRIEKSFLKFLKKNTSQETGSIRICSVQGKRLLYRDVPSAAETLELHYYAKPDALEDEEDTPDYIPEGLHHDLLVGFACKEIFKLLEDGISGPTINTDKWTGVYHAGVHELGLFIGEDGEAFNVGDDLESGDYIS
jgi:hypothetical protein